MSAIAAIGAQPSYTRASAVRPPSPTPRPVDNDDAPETRRQDKAAGESLRITA